MLDTHAGPFRLCCSPSSASQPHPLNLLLKGPVVSVQASNLLLHVNICPGCSRQATTHILVLLSQIGQRLLVGLRLGSEALHGHRTKCTAVGA